jgi:hypothetical protein
LISEIAYGTPVSTTAFVEMPSISTDRGVAERVMLDLVTIEE